MARYTVKDSVNNGLKLSITVHIILNIKDMITQPMKWKTNQSSQSQEGFFIYNERLSAQTVNIHTFNGLPHCFGSTFFHVI